jgi:hypothetical protein
MKPRSPTRGLYGQRPSKSADASRRAEFARIEALTPQERMLKALELRRLMGHFAGLLGRAEGWRER